MFLGKKALINTFSQISAVSATNPLPTLGGVARMQVSSLLSTR